jgi:retron-type reverse transcriptase
MGLLNMISDDLLVPKSKLEQLIATAPYRYKVYEIKKRSGIGSRTIAQPAREVKKLQYWIINKILKKETVHASAMAYVGKKNILLNASQHSHNPYILKIDFKDFFTSIKDYDFVKYAENNGNFGLTTEDIQKITKILFWRKEREKNLCLSIGAPSSPLLSNIIMREFDEAVSKYCISTNTVYTRYSDDITLSMDNKKTRSEIFEKINIIIQDLESPKLQINTNKTIFGSKANKRLITGLIINNNGVASLGRNKKRIIRVQAHRFSKGELASNEVESLKGMMAHIKMIDPVFFIKIKQKYRIP